MRAENYGLELMEVQAPFGTPGSAVFKSSLDLGDCCVTFRSGSSWNGGKDV